MFSTLPRSITVALCISFTCSIKLIPVQRTYRSNVKSTERTLVTDQAAAAASQNQAVVDQLQTVKKVLSNADILRSELNELVGEFTLADIPRKKVNVYMRSQKTIESFLNKIITKDTPRTDDKSNDLRLQIRKALEREYGYYLELMDGIMQNGWAHLQATSSDSQSRVDPIVTENTNASFKSRDEVKSVFLQWYERLDKSKRTEKVASKAKTTSGSYWYLWTVFAVVVFGGAMWWAYNMTAGARSRKRQIQRKIFFTKMTQLSSKWSTNSYKFIVTAINFLLFLLSGVVYAIRPFYSKVLSFLSNRYAKLARTLQSSATISSAPSSRRRKVVKSKTDERESLPKDAVDVPVAVSLDADFSSPKVPASEALAEERDVNPVWTTNNYVQSESEAIEAVCGFTGRDSPSSVLDRHSFEVEDQTDIVLYMQQSTPETKSGPTASPVVDTTDCLSDFPEDILFDKVAVKASDEDSGWNTAVPTKVRGRKVKQPVRSNSVPKSRQQQPVQANKAKIPVKKATVTEKQRPASVAATAVIVAPVPTNPVSLVLQTSLPPVATMTGDDSDTSASDLTADSGYATAAGETIYRSVSAPLQEYPMVSGEIYQQVYDGTGRPFSAPLPPAYYYYAPQMPSYIPISPMEMQQMYYAGQPPMQYLSYPSPDSVMTPAYYQMPMPVPQVMGEDSLLEAVKLQVEYYFSAENLCKDMYLRKRMDASGFVLLGEIVQFKRMQQINAPPAMIIQALKASTHLEVVLPWAAKVSPNQLSDGAILDSKIRCAEGWEQWVILPVTGNTSPKSNRLMEEIQP